MESAGTIDLGGLDVRYGPNIRKGSNYVELTVIGPSGTFVKEAHTPMHAAAAAALPQGIAVACVKRMST
nr:hypothetical protein [Ralstonia insidiosa]